MSRSVSMPIRRAALRHRQHADIEFIHQLRRGLQRIAQLHSPRVRRHHIDDLHGSAPLVGVTGHVTPVPGALPRTRLQPWLQQKPKWVEDKLACGTRAAGPADRSRQGGGLGEGAGESWHAAVADVLCWRTSSARCCFSTMAVACACASFTGTKRMLGQLAASLIASASARSFLPRLTKGFACCGAISLTVCPSLASSRPQWWDPPQASSVIVSGASLANQARNLLRLRSRR